MSKAKQQITKQDATEAIRSGLGLISEVRILSEVADAVRYGDDSGDEIVQNQLFVLQNVINEKLHDLHHAVDFVDDYFVQVPKGRAKKKKLTVVKAA